MFFSFGDKEKCTAERGYGGDEDQGYAPYKGMKNLCSNTRRVQDTHDWGALGHVDHHYSKIAADIR